MAANCHLTTDHHSTMRTIDPGHCYQLLTLDGDLAQRLVFVKRHDPADPSRYPGNTTSHPGTTLQSVIRALLERTRYLQRQVWCIENVGVIAALRTCLWLLEWRAARRHGTLYLHTCHYAEHAPMCPVCGHTQCRHDAAPLARPPLGCEADGPCR